MIVKNDPNQIINKVLIKFYGDKEASEAALKILTDNGFKAYGNIGDGNAYTTKRRRQGVDIVRDCHMSQ